jgi:cytochrome c oxidase subunit 4
MTEQALPRTTYYKIFGALVLLTLTTVLVYYLPLGVLHNAAALLIAVAKATLVVLFFMHLIHSSKLTWAAVVASLFWLVILFALTLSDYLSRPWLGVPGH